MPTVVMSTVPHGAAQSESSSVSLNLTFDDTTISHGDFSTIAGPDQRFGLGLIFDTSGGVGIPKNAVVTDVKLTLVPTTTLSATGGDAQHRIAFMASNGQWDRSPDNFLHYSVSGTVFGAPSRHLNGSFRGEDAIGGVAFDTDTAGAGATDFNTSSDIPGFGCTFFLAKNIRVKSLWVEIGRADTGDNSLLDFEFYELDGFGRHFAIKSHLKTTLPILYSALPLATVTEKEFLFIDGGIVASTEDRWLGVVLGGNIFNDGSTETNHRIRYRTHAQIDGTIYRNNSDGSLFHASRSVTEDNSLSRIAYPLASDIPRLFEDSSTNVLTTPYQRYVGNILAATDTTVAYVDGTPYNYGSPASGQMNVVTGIVAEFQAWIDSADFDPDNGKHFLGLMVEPLDPDDKMWDIAGDSHATYAKPELTITFTIPIPAVIPDILKSFGIGIDGTVLSSGVSSDHAISSAGVSSSGAVLSSGSEIEQVVGHHGTSATSAVVSFPITVGEC